MQTHLMSSLFKVYLTPGSKSLEEGFHAYRKGTEPHGVCNGSVASATRSMENINVLSLKMSKSRGFTPWLSGEQLARLLLGLSSMKQTSSKNFLQW